MASRIEAATTISARGGRCYTSFCKDLTFICKSYNKKIDLILAKIVTTNAMSSVQG